MTPELLDLLKDMRRSAKGFAAALDRVVAKLEEESEKLLGEAETLNHILSEDGRIIENKG